MCRPRLLTLLWVVAFAPAALAQPAGTQPASPARNAPRVAPVDPYAPAKPPRSSGKANPSGPVDPYAISDAAAHAAYAIAARHVVELRTEALRLVTARLVARQIVTEYELVQAIVRGMATRGLVGPSPSVAAGVNTAVDHYVPTAQATKAIEVGDLLVISIAGKIDKPEGIVASQTWCAIADKTVPAPIAAAFETIRLARDRAIATVIGRGRFTRGASDARVLPSFTVGQSILFAGQFGLRSEVSVFLTSPKPEMAPPVQAAVETLLP